MSDNKSYRDISRMNWIPGESVDNAKKVEVGSLQRIADATEVMAKNYLQMQREVEYYKTAYKDEQAKSEGLRNKIRGMKGYITKLKSKLSNENKKTEQSS